MNNEQIELALTREKARNKVWGKAEEDAARARIARGAELGLSPLASLEMINVVRGRLCMSADLLMGLVRKTGKLIRYEREEVDTDDPERAGVCVHMTRLHDSAGPETCSYTFRVKDAKRAGLWGGAVWAAYPIRMLEMRARGFVMRDLFADILAGMITTEEAADMPEVATQTTGTITEALNNANTLS